MEGRRGERQTCNSAASQANPAETATDQWWVPGTLAEAQRDRPRLERARADPGQTDKPRDPSLPVAARVVTDFGTRPSPDPSTARLCGRSAHRQRAAEKGLPRHRLPRGTGGLGSALTSRDSHRLVELQGRPKAGPDLSLQGRSRARLG
jgi:hypothetical protein